MSIMDLDDVFLVMGFLKGIPKELDEAATLTDAASSVFFTVFFCR